MSLQRRIGYILQALVYGVLAYALGLRWVGYSVIVGIAAFLQLASMLLSERGSRIASGLTIVLILGLYGELLGQSWYLYRAFGEQTGDSIWGPLAGAGLLLPWLLAWPFSQLRSVSPLLLLGILPVLQGAIGRVPERREDGWAAGLEGQWQGGKLAELPEGTVITPFVNGKSLKTVAAKEAVPGPKKGMALLIEVPVGTTGGVVWPGRDAPSGISPHAYARSLRRREWLPGVNIPSAPDARRYEAALVSESGTTILEDGWSKAPIFGYESALSSVRSGALFLMNNLQEDGRFTYIVRGPSGKPGAGYNYPRHAGTAWFLARAAAYFEDPQMGAAADRALAHLEAVSQKTKDGRSYVLDPTRNDGKAWVGTTALGLMAMSLRHTNPQLANTWLAQVAASVDDQGKVRGEMLIQTGVFLEQPTNPYGQGQAMLALLLAERSGLDAGKTALDRAIHYLQHDYAGSSAPLVVADEHWMCLVALALHTVRGSDAADRICSAYLSLQNGYTPVPGAALQPASGPAGGLAEAVAAHAKVTGSGREDARRYGWLFLRSQYRAEDAPMLETAEKLVGGYRDSPGELDVQIDAVQHIGSALLGIAALEGAPEKEGSWP